MLQDNGTHPAIAAALTYLSGQCDGAVEQDGVGFNGSDSGRGKALAAQPELGPNEQSSALKMLRKYKGQLEKAEIVLPSDEELHKFLVKQIKKPVRVTVPESEAEESLEVELEEIEIQPVSDHYDADWFLESTADLSEEQRDAFRAVTGFALSDDLELQLYLLTGFAGSGKSFTVQRIVKYLQRMRPDMKILMSAPTHKATQVLRRMAGNAGLQDVDFSTVASAIGLRVVGYTTEGDEIFAPGAESTESKVEPLSSYNLAIIDECSMVGKELFEHIKNRMGECKLLFVGDSAQLPPVNEVESPTFQVGARSTLTQIVRYAGEVLLAATEVRENLHKEALTVPVTAWDSNDKRSGVCVGSPAAWENTMLKVFTSQASLDDSDYCRALAWTNERVRELNQMIRWAIYGEDAETFMEGERLVAKKPIQEERVNAAGYLEKQTILNTCSEAVVIEAHTGQVSCRALKIPVLKVWFITVISEMGLRATRTIPHEDDWTKFEKALLEERKTIAAAVKATGNKGQWKAFYELCEQFNVYVDKSKVIGRFQYAYALTVHQSQGSTFSNVFMDLRNILRNKKRPKERNQLMYVAQTRASDRLFIAL